MVLPSGSADWDAVIERLGDADVYHLAAYHRVAEANGEGVAEAFVAEEGGDLLFHPFLRRPIASVGDEAVDGGWCDLESAYGYVGPLSTGGDAAFIERAWSEFHDWCVQEHVVAEFVRFNPLLGNERFADPAAEVIVDRATVVLELPEDVGLLWRAYPSVQRNMVRKAGAAGLEAEVLSLAEGLDGFRAVYTETMQRAEADPYYRFGDAYFDALAELETHVRVVVVRGTEGVAAAALLLVRAPRLHYHLAGSTGWARPLGANNLLLHEAASWGCSENLRVFHLGGGRTSSPDDSLLRFKRSVSASRRRFHTGRRVHDRSKYEALCDSWLRQAQPTERTAYFLLYRSTIG